MSRGLSAQQRAILAVVEEGPRMILDLVKRLDRGTDRNSYESVGRALRSLVKRGLIAEMGGWPKRYGTLTAAEERDRLQMLVLAWRTVAGRAAIIHALGHLPTLSEWLKVGNLEMLDNPNTYRADQRAAQEAA